MLAVSHNAPTALIAAALLFCLLTGVVSAVLVWHWIRRLLNITRVPRRRAVYMALAIAWGALATSCAAVLMTAMLLRDHRLIDRRTELGEVRCEPERPGHMRIEVSAAGSATERYDVEGNECVLSVTELEMRPALKALGVEQLVRVEGAGSAPRATIERARVRMLGLVVRDARAIPVTVPADAHRRFVLVATPGHDPVLEAAPTHVGAIGKPAGHHLAGGHERERNGELDPGAAAAAAG